MSIYHKLICLFICVYLCADCLASESADNILQTFLMKPATLLANKQKITGNDPQLCKALSAVIQKADKAMNNAPYSVTYKTKVPPSGNKHDYMSVGPYWWPDPDKPDGLPYIRKDGQVNPERYEIKDVTYFKNLCRDVQLLAVTSFFTGKKEYADKAVNLLQVWFLDTATMMNPNLNYGQAIPGHTEGRGIGLIDTREFVYLIDGIQILKATNALPEIKYEALQNWFLQYSEWLTTSPVGLDEADEHNNHGTYYDVQSLSIALFLKQTGQALKIVETQTKARVESQLKADGSQPHELARTMSWNYSQMNLHGFFELAMLSENLNIDMWNYTTPEGKSIKKAFLWMLPFAEGAPWKYQQIKPANKDMFVTLTRIASLKYPDINVAAYLKQQGENPDNLFILIN